MTPKVVAPAAGKHLTRLSSVFLFSRGIKQNDILLIPRECVTGAAKTVFSRSPKFMRRDDESRHFRVAQSPPPRFMILLLAAHTSSYELWELEREMLSR